MDATNPFGVYFNLMKIRYAIYDSALSSTDFLKPSDQVNVFINIETAIKYVSMTKDLEKKLVTTRNFQDLMKVDIINIAAHYKDFFKGNGLNCRIFLYMTDLESDSDKFKESKYIEDFRSYYILKYTSNPRFTMFGDALMTNILPDVKTICDYIPGVYFINGKNIDSGIIPFIIGNIYPGWKNIIISGDLYDTQYSYEPNFLDCYYTRTYNNATIAFTTKDFLKAISKVEEIDTSIINLFKNASFYTVLLSIIGDKYRSVPSVKGIKFKTLAKILADGLKENKIQETTRNASLISSIFTSDNQKNIYDNFSAIDIRHKYDMLTDGDRKSILSQIIDRSDINALQQLNRTRFENNPLRLEGLL